MIAQLMRVSVFFVFVISLMGCSTGQKASGELRVAIFNIKELSTEKLKNVDETTGAGRDIQLLAAAKIIQQINPDVLIINEIDHDYQSQGADLTLNLQRFQDAYLSQGLAGIRFTGFFAAPCNTGIPSGLDLSGDGIVADETQIGSRDYGNDCFGYGSYPGQYAMGIFSKFTIDSAAVRTFQKFLWKDLPGNHIPEGYYTPEAIEVLRLSSKSHWDIPLVVDNVRLHLFVSHPTPLGFDGDEDKNGRRNFDEIKFWVNYLANDPAIYDDDNVHGGYAKDEPFVIVGDLNASPKSESVYDDKTAIDQLLKHPEIADTGIWLTSDGGWQGRKVGAPDHWERNTARFGTDFRTRIDYILPKKDLIIKDGSVYWPVASSDSTGNRLAETASDHRLVWLDIVL